MKEESKSVLVLGSGMGSLCAAALLASDGFKVQVLEQNWIPGGCSTSYWRKGFVFETGATTLVGLDKGMPLEFVLSKCGINLNPVKLTIPMQIRLSNGKVLTRFNNLEEWINEAEKVFGTQQRAFWEYCYKVSKMVWETSLKQLSFPPENLDDILSSVRNVSFNQLRSLPLAYRSIKQLLQLFGLANDPVFTTFINQQLMITAQNKMEEVNQLFGCTALCYTLFGNYYLNGGMQNLVKPICEYIEKQGGQILLKQRIEKVSFSGKKYWATTNKGLFMAEYLVSGLTMNNLYEIKEDTIVPFSWQKPLPSKKLNGAFQIGIGFKNYAQANAQCLHHQLILEVPIEGIDAESLFLSFSHPDDTSRSDEAGHGVLSVSCHIPDPEKKYKLDYEPIADAIMSQVYKSGLLKPEQLVYMHYSPPAVWEKWTARKWGFVGGYPQFLKVKPWNIRAARLDGKKAYICGDTVYPGQGIPGVALSGIIAWHKLKQDAKKS